MSLEITAVSTATAVGLFAATSFFAISMSVSFSAVPALLLPAVETSLNSKTNSPRVGNVKPASTPSHIVRQWKVIFDDGKKAGPFVTGIGTASWVYVASVLPAGESRGRLLYVIGALLSISIIPFTFTVMRKTVKELCDRAEVAESGRALEEEHSSENKLGVSTVEVVKYWSWLNALRGLLPLVGMGCVIAANLK